MHSFTGDQHSKNYLIENLLCFVGPINLLILRTCFVVAAVVFIVLNFSNIRGGERGHLSSCIWNLGVSSVRCTSESLPLRVDFIHRVEFGEVSWHRLLSKRGSGNRGASQCGSPHEATSGMASWDRPHPEVRPEGREPLPDKAGESTLLSRSGG